MKYKIIWHDWEDDRTGESFVVEGKTPFEAYFKAIDTITGYSEVLKEHFVSTDIESLIDENGKRYDADHLGDSIKDYENKIKPELKRQVDDSYSKGKLGKATFEQSISLDTILDRKMHYSETLFDDGGSNAHFVDYISESHLYDLSDLLSGKTKNFSLSKLELQVASPYSTTAREAIKEFEDQGKNVTHLVLYSERYGGDDSSVWHNPFPTVIYELK